MPNEPSYVFQISLFFPDVSDGLLNEAVNASATADTYVVARFIAEAVGIVTAVFDHNSPDMPFEITKVEKLGKCVTKADLPKGEPHDR